MIPPRGVTAAQPPPERRRPERTWTRREYKGRRKPLHRLLIVSAATVLLIVGGGIAAPSTVSVSALQLMLPFFAILAVASIGQHLVIQQRGLEFCGRDHRPPIQQPVGIAEGKLGAGV